MKVSLPSFARLVAWYRRRRARRILRELSKAIRILPAEHREELTTVLASLSTQAKIAQDRQLAARVAEIERAEKRAA